MTKWSALLLVLLSALPGCSNRQKSKGTIGISVLTLTNPFFKVIADTMAEEAAKRGFDVIVVSGELDVTRQKNQVEDFIVRGVDAIVLCPCDSQAIGAVIQKANHEGIPVFTADIACADKRARVVCHIATDNKGGGREAAKGMIEALGAAGGKVLILDYNEVESCQQRVAGFEEVIREHNEKGGATIAIVRKSPGYGAKDKSFTATEAALQEFADLAGIFAINDPSALGARAALERAGKAERIKIIGFDGQPDGKEAIRQGKIYADPVQFPDRIGAKTAEAIFRHLDGERLPAEILIPTELYRGKD